MNRLVTLIIILVTFCFMASYAWAGQARHEMNPFDAYQGLSPAAFFGYTGIDTEPVNQEFNQGKAVNVHEDKVLTSDNVSYDELSPAQFFGYTNPNMVPAKITLAHVKCIRNAACCGFTSEDTQSAPCCRFR